MFEALDTNHDTTAKLGQLKALGIRTVIRYVATGDKSITPNEARRYGPVGMRLGLVYEAWGDTHHEINSLLGTQHGQAAVAKAPLVGAPDNAVIYFAIDNDESATDIRNRIIPYFAAVKSALRGKYRVGVYGSGNVCAAVLDAGLASHAWLSNATGWGGFTTFKASGRWCLLQHLPANVAGLDTDPDEINPSNPDIGDFVPFGDAGPVPIEKDLRYVQAALNRLGAIPPLVADGIYGPKTLDAIVVQLDKDLGRM